MSFPLNYPLSLIALDGGYVSVVDADEADPRPHYLAVFTSEDVAETFMQRCGVLGAIKEIHSARDFAWLLQSVRPPVTRVAFDPEPLSLTVQGRWLVEIQEMLNEHLLIDYSPWNYPAYVIRQPSGYASIHGETSHGSQWMAVSVFTSREKAVAFLTASGGAGEVEEVANLAAARKLLESLKDVVQAVAIDPTIEDDRHNAQHCLGLQNVLDKYLVQTKPGVP
jgi:hypothetical protein